MVSSIILQNENGTTTLLDLPRSIEYGQQSPFACILSTPPLKRPHPSTEPRASKRQKLLGRISPTEQEYHHKLQTLILESLKEIKSSLCGRSWCLSRRYATPPLQQISAPCPLLQHHDPSQPHPPVILSRIPNIFPSLDAIADCVFHNPSALGVELIVGDHVYHIPSCSSFLMSNVTTESDPFSSVPPAILSHTFDFVLMDPPWNNRSVRRSSSYMMSGTGPFLDALSLVHRLIRTAGFIGVWITNKSILRQAVLTSLYQYQFKLVEEWIWIKITASGEPVLPLDGLWRRPYEVLLLFCRDEQLRHKALGLKHPASILDWDMAKTHRVLAAVPGAHSMKPCLKELIGKELFNSRSFQCLEIFARKVTAGWFSWGNEVLKFNEASHWTCGSE